MSKAYDVLVAGEINPDLILSGDVLPAFGQVEKLIDGLTLTIGSSSVIFACGAARLGLRVAFAGRCGDDLFGRFMLEEMTRCGIDVGPVQVIPGGRTGVSVILNRGVDRAILTYPGLMDSLTAEEISDDLLARARHLHVASYFLQTALQPDLPALFRRAQAFGLTTSLDTNYDPSEQWQHFDDLLSATNLFLPNETEACSLTRSAQLEEAAQRLMAQVEMVAIKLGARGALAGRGGQTAQVNAIPVQVVDTVGAGDSFDAGFVYGYLHGWPLERSLKLAAVCGGLSTQAAGGTAAQPTLAEALSWLER
jgi:sugar/nucleoside kinase (ribokinase family)